jgi:hypothetical protein
MHDILLIPAGFAFVLFAVAYPLNLIRREITRNRYWLDLLLLQGIGFVVALCFGLRPALGWLLGCAFGVPIAELFRMRIAPQ